MESTAPLLNLKGLARHLGVPVTWLRAEADRGRLPHVKAGSQRLFNVAAVERVLAERAAEDSDHARAAQGGRS